VGYEGEIPFRNGKKPISFLKHLFELAGLKDDENAIVLDFFSGSGSIAHALMEFNNEDKGNRKFILIQIPEECSEKDEAYVKYNLETICQIGEERIRRSGDLIVEESGNTNLDTGFKVFKLDSSNLEKWDPDYNNIQQSLTVDQIKPDRTNEDLIYEIMLKYGIDLTMPIEQQGKIYSIGFGALILCLDDNITKDTTEDIIKLTKDSSISRVVFKDSGFVSDADKTNIKEILRNNDIDEFITI
jgi:adenine-specific DNA-methyltransferase